MGLRTSRVHLTAICKCGCGTVIRRYGSNGLERVYVKGHQRPWLGKKRLSMIGNKYARPGFGKDNIFSKITKPGDKHPRWVGGKYNYWRRAALYRDDFTCQRCKLRDPEIMEVDHIIPIRGNKRRFSEIPKMTYSHTLKGRVS